MHSLRIQQVSCIAFASSIHKPLTALSTHGPTRNRTPADRRRRLESLSLSLSTLYGFKESVGKYMEEKIDILVL